MSPQNSLNSKFKSSTETTAPFNSKSTTNHKIILPNLYECFGDFRKTIIINIPIQQLDKIEMLHLLMIREVILQQQNALKSFILIKSNLNLLIVMELHPHRYKLWEIVRCKSF